MAENRQKLGGTGEQIPPQPDDTLTFHFQPINFCWTRPPSLQHFVTAALGNRSAARERGLEGPGRPEEILDFILRAMGSHRPGVSSKKGP